MAIADSFLAEFDQEMTTTRRVLERVPEAHAKWKPHAKSYSLGDLALHCARLLTWVEITLKQTDFDVNPPGGGPKPPTFESTAALLATFDQNVKAARAALRSTSDADFMAGWTLKSAGKPLFTLPRVACMRSFVMNHLIHHRGQLSVYLRLRDVALPSIYGPTADEAMF
jgi:uncharacterized damage-inducible protein DinB